MHSIVSNNFAMCVCALMISYMPTLQMVPAFSPVFCVVFFSPSLLTWSILISYSLFMFLLKGQETEECLPQFVIGFS